MQALSDESRVVTMADLDAFDSQFPKQTTSPAFPQDQSRIVTIDDLDAFEPPGYRWQSPSLSVPRETLEQAKIPVAAEAEASASKLTQIENITRPVKRISLEGQGEFLKAAGADIINSVIDGKPTLENLHAAWRTEQLPIDEQLAQQTGLGATITRGIGSVVGSVPSLIEGGVAGKALGAMTVGPRLAMSAGYGAAMGSEAYSRTQGDWDQAMKSAAVGAAFPVVGRWAATAGAKVAKIAVEKGVPLADRNTVQKLIEFGIEQSALQAFNHVISTPEYLDLYSQGGADAVKQAILENTIALGVYAIPGIVRTLSPRFPSELARTIAQEARKDLDKALESAVTTPDFGKKLAEAQAEAVKQQTKATEVLDASTITGPEKVGVRGEGGEVGTETPLRQSGETAPIRAPEADKRAASVTPQAPVIDPTTGLLTTPGTTPFPSPVDMLLAAEKARAAKAPPLSPGTEGTTPKTPEQQPASVPGEVAAKTEAQKVKDYAAAMAPSAVPFIKRAIESGTEPKKAHLAWAREIGKGLQDTPDEVYRKERSGLYTSSYVRSVLGTIEGVVLNAKEYFKAVDEGRQEGIKWKEGVMERQRAITAPQPPPSPAKQREPWEMTTQEQAVIAAIQRNSIFPRDIASEVSRSSNIKLEEYEAIQILRDLAKRGIVRLNPHRGFWEIASDISNQQFPGQKAWVDAKITMAEKRESPVPPAVQSEANKISKEIGPTVIESGEISPSVGKAGLWTKIIRFLSADANYRLTFNEIASKLDKAGYPLFAKAVRFTPQWIRAREIAVYERSGETDSYRKSRGDYGLLYLKDKANLHEFSHYIFDSLPSDIRSRVLEILGKIDLAKALGYEDLRSYIESYKRTAADTPEEATAHEIFAMAAENWYAKKLGAIAKPHPHIPKEAVEFVNGLLESKTKPAIKLPSASPDLAPKPVAPPKAEVATAEKQAKAQGMETEKATPASTAIETQVEKPQPPASVQKKPTPATGALSPREQKKYLFTEAEKAWAKAPDEHAVTEHPRKAEAESDRAILNQIESEVPTPKSVFPEKNYLSDDDFKALRSAVDEWWKTKESELQPLFDRWGIRKKVSAGYKTLDPEHPSPPKESSMATLAAELREILNETIFGIRDTVIIDIPGDGTFEIFNNKTSIKNFMERAKKFPVTVPRPRESTGVRIDPDSPPPVQKGRTMESDLKAIQSHLSTDPSRRVVQYYISDGSHVVATDGRRMVIVDRKGPGTPKKRVLLDENGKPISDKGLIAPDFNQVIPEKTDLWFSDLDTGRLFNLVKQALGALDEKTTSVAIYKDKEGRIGIYAKSESLGEYASGITETSKPLIFLDGNYLLDAINSARRLGAEKIDVRGTDEMAPILFSGKGFKVIVMPMRGTGFFKGSEIMSQVRPAGISEPAEQSTKRPPLRLGTVELDHRGGEIPNTPGAKDGMKILEKAIGDMGDVAKRFTGIRFDKSTGFGLEVRGDEPQTLVVDPERLAESAKMLRGRYRKGTAAAVDEEIIHSFQHEVLNALEKSSPGIGKRMFDELSEADRKKTWELYGSKLGEAETVLEYLRMKYQKERGVLTEKFTRRAASIFKQPLTQTMRDFTNAVADFVRNLFGEKMPTQIQAFYDAVVKMKEGAEKGAAGERPKHAWEDTREQFLEKYRGSGLSYRLYQTPEYRAVNPKILIEDQMLDAFYTRETEKAFLAGKTVKEKPLWAMTQKEFVEKTGNDPDEHRLTVEEALRRSIPVPKEVLKDYPDIKPPTTGEPPITLQAARVQTPEDIKRQEQAKRLFLSGMSEREVADEVNHTRNYGYGPIHATLEKGRAAFNALPDAVKQFLPFISNKLNASDTAAGDQPVIPRNPGETLKSYAERLTTGTDKEVREQHTADILIETCDQFQDLRDNRRDFAGTDIPREVKKLQEILAERETLKFERAMELTSAEHTISEDILHNYQRRLLNARDAIKAVARRTAEQDTMLELYQEQLDMLEGFVRNNDVIGKMLTDATKVFTDAELADPNLTAKQIAKRLETADLPHVTKDPKQRKFIANMLAEWRDLRQEIQTLKGAGELTAEDFSKAIQAKMADIKALQPGEVKKVMNAYATAKAKEKLAWELVKRNQKAWQKQADKLDNMLKALDWLDEFMTSPEHRADEMELAREYNITYQAFKEDSVTGARTYTNPNPIPEDPELAALYVPSITVDPAREWTRENFKENWNKLNTYRAWLDEYMANGKDPSKILMAERQAYILDSFHLNPELNPEIGRALRPVPWWMDPWQLLGKITGIRSPYHVARMMPGRMGNEVYAALIRWNTAKTRAMPVLANTGRKVQDACLAAAKSHGMTLAQWSETINNRILHSRNVAGVTPEGENTHYPWDNFTVTREDMAAVRAQRDMANRMRRDALPEDDPLMKMDQLKIVVKDAQISREAQGGPYTMRRKWSEAGMTIAEKLYTMAKKGDWEGIRKLLDGDYMLNNFIMRHIHDAVFDADYTVGKSSPLLNTYRDYMQRLILEPGKWRATSLDDLSNKLVDCGAVDAKGELMSPAKVRSVIVSEFVKQAKNIYDPAPGVKVPEGRTGPEVEIETGDNFLTIPRGETVASGGFYDYSLATAEQQMAFYGDIERPYYARYISALTRQTDAIRNRIKDLEGEISRKYGTGIGDWKRSRLIRTETRQQRTEKDIWLDYDDLKMQLRRHESLLTQLNAHMDNMRSRTGAMHFFGWLKRIISAHLLSPPQTGIRNVGGSRTMGAALSMLMGTRYAPFAEHRFMNDLASAYHRIPLLSDTTNLAKDMTVYAYEIGKTLLKFLERLPTDNEPVRKAIQTIRKDPRRWGRFLVAVADQVHRNQVEFDRLVANGIVDRANLWQHIRADVMYARTAGEATKELGSIPEQLGNVAKTGVNLITRGPSATVGAYENMGNRSGIMDAERNIAHWQANILNAYSNRRANGVSIDDSTLSPQEIIGRHESEKQWAHLRALLGPGVNLQYMAKRFAKEYFAAKDAGKPTDEIELMTEGEKEHLVGRYVELNNKGTAGTRPPPAGPLANLMDTFWRYGFYQTEIFSEARGKLAADTWKFDPNFYTSRMIYMYALSGLLFMAPITWVISNLFRKERAVPKPSQANSWSDLAMISMIHSQSLVPPVWSFMISIPSQVFGSKWSVNTGMSVVPISLINSGWNWMREMVQTHDALRPTVKLLSQWMPFTQIPLNRDPAFAGTRALKNANILLGVVGTAAGTEMRPAASGPAGVKTPLTPVIDDLVNYLVAPNGPNWQEVYSLMGKARQMLIEKGNMEPDQTINRMVMARTPMQSRVGRQMTASEVAKTAARYAPEDYAELARIEGAFAQFAAVTGGPAPAALTMPKASRRDLVAGGGGPGASAMAGPPGGGGGYGGGGPRMVSAGMPSSGIARVTRMPAFGARMPARGVRRGRRVGRGIVRRPAALRRLKVKSAKVRLASVGRKRPYRMVV